MTNDSPRRTPALVSRRQLGAVLMFLGLNGVFFFHGCENKEFRVTIGCLFPAAELSVTEVKLSSRPDPPEILLPTRVVSWSPSLLIGNAMAAAAIAFWVQRRSERSRYVRCLYFAFWPILALFNSFIVFAYGWYYAVFCPTLGIAWAAAWIVTLGAASEGDPLTRQLIPWATRLYFIVAVLVLGALLMLLFRRKHAASERR